MTERVYVKPGEGRRVRHPETRLPIPAEGADLVRDLFVRRRIAAGDLVVTERPSPAATAPAEAPPPSTPTAKKGS
ncbi:DUF2635 domain-containing protein [Plastoroseomonas hellenica]|uniref:DUF2635 domain-containing protein n=1 Tax=Plastoroseomonas hellenica TaxID=2687306 RepID=UPI001BA5BE57|nr:DUF2635 domain-containing protein [Plastoroseomonas hellenica]MBR0643989.1 DUF2635 domain-containing protein [Plastoroseomonas hellenica]